MSLTNATEQALDAIAEKHGSRWTEIKRKQFAALVADVKAYKPINPWIKNQQPKKEEKTMACKICHKEFNSSHDLYPNFCDECDPVEVVRTALAQLETRKIEITDEIIERAASIHWNETASIKWEAIPMDWKPFYLNKMRKALEAVMK